mmetsp:Transcript_39823/g.86160  ORF Transcript_39823/g.86160 Transcript_39823/m.86160 type:complete len:215 (+) Transcript_39823:241-885(+)
MCCTDGSRVQLGHAVEGKVAGCLLLGLSCREFVRRCCICPAGCWHGLSLCCHFLERFGHRYADGRRLRIWAYVATFDPAWGGGIAPDAHDDATIVGICSCIRTRMLAGCQSAFDAIWSNRSICLGAIDLLSGRMAGQFRHFRDCELVACIPLAGICHDQVSRSWHGDRPKDVGGCLGQYWRGCSGNRRHRKSRLVVAIVGVEAPGFPSLVGCAL